MSHRKKALLCWSSGKDSAWTFQVLRQQAVEVVGLVTTVNETFARVAMHGVREVLVEKQAEAAGVPLWKVPIPHRCSNEEYEKAMTSVIERARSEGVAAIAFGDLFLADIRAYREKQLAGTGIEPLFPIWGLSTEALAREMVAAGVRARITCVDPNQLPRHFVGRIFDGDLLDELPGNVDPCGERGEFHTFCYAGPMFRESIEVVLGEITERDGFVFADLR